MRAPYHGALTSFAEIQCMRVAVPRIVVLDHHPLDCVDRGFQQPLRLQLPFALGVFSLAAELRRLLL